MTSAPAVVSLRGATVRRGSRTIWSDVSLESRPGEFVAVLGPNGAGKSTLLKVLLGIVPLAGGSATLLGSEPGDASSQIGYLPQRRTFDDATRVRGIDVVRLGLDGNRWGFPLPLVNRRHHAALRERVDRALELTGATAYAHRPIGRLSGGEQQRLLIAQALAGDPRVLMLDEPLDSLDLPNQSGIAALLHRICRDQAMSVLLVAHDVNPILPYLDRVIYFANGTAVSGTPNDVIDSATLTQLYGTPIDVLETSDGRKVVIGTPEAPFVHGGRHDHAHLHAHGHEH